MKKKQKTRNIPRPQIPVCKWNQKDTYTSLKRFAMTTNVSEADFGSLSYAVCYVYIMDHKTLNMHALSAFSILWTDSVCLDKFVLPCIEDKPSKSTNFGETK